MTPAVVIGSVSLFIVAELLEIGGDASFGSGCARAEERAELRLASRLRHPLRPNRCAHGHARGPGVRRGDHGPEDRSRNSSTDVALPRPATTAVAAILQLGYGGFLGGALASVLRRASSGAGSGSGSCGSPCTWWFFTSSVEACSTPPRRR